VTLRGKLLLAQLPLALSLVVVGVVSRQTVRSLDYNSQEILKDNHLSVLAAQRMRDAADVLAGAARARAHERSGATEAEIAQRRAVFDRELKFQEGNITETGEREATERLHAQWQLLQTIFDQIMAPGAGSEARLRIYFDDLEPALSALKTSTAEIVTLNQDAMLRKSDRARKRAQWMSSAMLLATIAAFALGLMASLFITNRLTRPLAILAQAVRRLAQGDLGARVRLPGKDELAQVASELNTMAEKLSEYRSSSLGELLQAQQSSQAAIDSLPDPVLVLQLGGGLLNANRAAASLFGVDTDVAGDAALERVPKEVRDIIDKLRQHVAGGKGAYVPKGLEEAVAVQVRDGQQYFLARANPVEAEHGQVIGLTLLFQDVTRLRRFDELKTDMVATVAHEFRTPLTSLRMAIHLCVEGAAGTLSPKQEELLSGAREDCERLQGIVDDILDLSRIQSGRVELHKRTVSAGALLAQAVDDHRQLARDRDIDLHVSALTIDRPVSADPERIRLVFSNLLSNALRHTPRGGTIEVRAAPESGAVRFEVSDTGPGIPKAYQSRLFERFFQVPGVAEGGAGLGLFICKEIVEAHGGRIGVESDPGEGTIFWFIVPAAQSSLAEGAT
jgi:signal transduction histidine kinase/HAMP domain-containing protein